MSKVVAIIQARMGSSRLPGKVLAPINGVPMLQHVVQRTRRSNLVDEVVVATTHRESDRPIIDFCQNQQVRVFRGSETDVLGRFLGCAQQHGADQVVRITADCPLIDPVILDRVIETRTTWNSDYASNFLPHRWLPRGLDVEVFQREALERAEALATEPRFREHVTLLMYERNDLFRSRGWRPMPEDFPGGEKADFSDWRWTVDTPEDLTLVRLIFGGFADEPFGWHEAVRVCEDHPRWRAVNQHVQQRVA